MWDPGRHPEGAAELPGLCPAYWPWETSLTPGSVSREDTVEQSTPWEEFQSQMGLGRWLRSHMLACAPPQAGGVQMAGEDVDHTPQPLVMLG